MSVVKIYLKLADGGLEYRDSEGHHGKTITTHLKPGSKIIWKLDRHSRISEIKNITLKGDDAILKEKPVKLDFDHWEAIGAGSGEGELAYNVEVEKCRECVDAEVIGSQEIKDPQRPLLRMP
jgi:hypothetical protein